MNLYFLVEGRQCERRLYPRWLSYLLPHFAQVEGFDVVESNHYFLISGEGFPRLLTNHLPNAVADVNKVGRYAYLVLCLDADEDTVAERTAEVCDYYSRAERLLHDCELKIVVQNRCIETWFLGNSRILTRAPQSRRLADFIRFYDVRVDDPEAMGVLRGYRNHADFHGTYLKEMFRERRISYTKEHPGHVAEQAYLDQLLARTTRDPSHLRSFQDFVQFCADVRGRTRPAA